jgi:hypothetical protein
MYAARSMLVSSVLFALAACAGSDGRSADATSPTTPSGGVTSTPAPLPVPNAGLSGKALVYDDFTRYSNTAALQNNISTVAGGKGAHSTALYKDGYNASLAELDKSVKYNGHATLKYNQPAGTSKTPALWVYFPNNQRLTNMWFRAKIRFSTGFTTRGTTSAANSYKLLGWAWAGADGRATIEITNTNQYLIDWTVTTSDKSKVGPFAYKNEPRITNEWTDGQWYDYIVLYEQTSSTTVRQSWWLARDGQKPVLRGTVTGTMSKGTVPPVNRVMLGLNFNQTRSKAQALWIGQWEVIDGSTHSDPFGVKSGTGGSTTPPPTTTPPVDTTPTKPPVDTTPTPPPPSEPTPTKPPVDTPVTPPTTPTTPPTNPGSGLSGKAFVYDDFRSYSGTSALLANISTVAGGTGGSGSLYRDGYNAKLAEIDKSVLYNGHQTVKYNQPGGTSASPGLWVSFPSGKRLTKMWFRVKVRFSPGYTTSGVTSGSAKAYKLLGWAWAGADGRATLEITNTNQYVFDWSVTGSASGPYTYKSDPKISTEWSDGQWYDYIICYEQTSSTTIRQRWWLAKDGQTPQLKADIKATMRSGTVPPVNRVMLGLNFNQTRASGQNQALWIGQWEVVDGNEHSNPFGL